MCGHNSDLSATHKHCWYEKSVSHNQKLLSQHKWMLLQFIFLMLKTERWFLSSHSQRMAVTTAEQDKNPNIMQPWYVSMERVWHALRACVVNSNGTTDPQLDLWADSTHPPTRPSVLLCIVKQAWCMQRARNPCCTGDTCDSLGSSADLWTALRLWCIQGLTKERKSHLCPLDDNSGLHHTVVLDHYHFLCVQPGVSSAASYLVCRVPTCL